MGGATLDEPVKEGEGMKINGSAMIFCADSQEEVMEIIKSDVYTESKVWNLNKVGKDILIQRRHLGSCWVKRHLP